jgi:hypothetical protein
MHVALALVLLLASEPPKSLSPAAAEHNTKAMQHYDAGQYGLAADEFHAAYLTMPDARRDREGRELLIGSIRASLLTQYQQTGEVEPLCRMQKILQAHVGALVEAFPEDPDMLETRSIRARHEEVTAKLAAIGPNACDPPPPPAVAAPVVAPTPAPAPAPAVVTPAPDSIPPRQLKIAGGVTLGLGGVLLAVMTYGIVKEAQARGKAGEIRDGSPDCPLTPDEYTALQNLRSDARTGRNIAIGTGMAAGVSVALGGAFFGLARRSKRWSAAPWWSPTGAGFNLLVHIGAKR